MKIKFKNYEKFPDHYNYSDTDLSRLKEVAKSTGCELLTTEKDYFRIKNLIEKNKLFKVELLIDQEKQFYKYLHEDYEINKIFL